MARGQKKKAEAAKGAANASPEQANVNAANNADNVSAEQAKADAEKAAKNASGKQAKTAKNAEKTLSGKNAEKAKAIFASHPNEKVLHFTSDGFAFFQECSAVEHASTLKDKEIVTVTK